MLSKIRDERPWWFLPALAFFLGLFIGWFVIGWGLWPVTYKNSLPQDLRAAEQQEYLRLAAESFAANGDLALARQRLATWPEDDLQAALLTLEERLQSENPLQASQVQLLTGALALPTTVEGTGDVPAVEAPAGGAPAGGALEPSTEVSELLQTACKTALWVLLVLGGILGILYLWRRWQASSQASQPAIEGTAPAPVARQAGQEAFPEVVETYEGESERTVIGPTWRQDTGQLAGEAVVYQEVETFEDETFEDEVELEETDEDLAGPVTDAGVTVTGVGRQFPRPEAAAVAAGAAVAGAATAGAAAAASTGAMTKVGEYRAQYELGTADYDEAFDIFDANGAYIGQCGLGLVDPVGASHDQAAALQVWMWDTNDSETKVKVLISEGAHRDAALRDRLGGEHEVIPIREGTPFELRSFNLLLKGVVEKIEYAEQEPVNGIFSDVQVRMAVYLK
jgi:hypothetical protein